MVYRVYNKTERKKIGRYLWFNLESGFPVSFTGKIQMFSFDRSNNNGSIDVKMGGSILEEKLSFKMLGLTFSSKLDWGSCIISIAKTAS